jgi:hypothetical protein
MTGRTKKTAVVAKPPKPSAKQVTRTTLGAATNSAAVVMEYGKVFGEQDVQTLVGELEASIKRIQDGDMRKCEALLMGQAQALQSMFMSFARRALVQEYQPNLESFFRMALKAQNQCRMTLETLATIKNPPIVFAKQANFAAGHQQVNNGVLANAPPAHAREEKPIQSNELLTDGVEHGPTLDTRGTPTAGGADKELATVGTIDRPALE